MKTRILVTGGAGFIGSHFVDRLVDEGYETAVVDNLSNGKLNNINKKAQFIEADITSQKLSQIFRRLSPQIVFHLAAQSSISKSLKAPSSDIKINLLATQNILELSKLANVTKIIFSSSAAVYKPSNNLPLNENLPKEPISLYGVSKLCSEFLIRNFHKLHNLPYASLRLANVYGPRQDFTAEGGVVSIFTQKLLEGSIAKIHGNGTQTRDFIYVSDVVEAFVNSLRGEVIGEFNIGSNKETSINNLLNILFRVTKSKVGKKYVSLPHVEVQKSALSYLKFKNLTTWSPKVSLEEGLSRTYDYFNNL